MRKIVIRKDDMKIILTIICSTFIFVFACHGALVTFDFSGASGINSSWSTGTTADPDTIVSAFTDGAGITAVSGNGRLNASAWTQTGGLAVAEANNDYLTFTITPQGGYALNLNSAVVTFTLQVSSTGPHSYSLVDEVGTSSITDLQDGTFNPGSQTGSLSYTFGSLGNDDITSGIEFRIYGYDSTAGSGTMSINAFSLSGTVSAVPEFSASGAVSGAALLALCGVRFWQQRRQSLAGVV